MRDAAILVVCVALVLGGARAGHAGATSPTLVVSLASGMAVDGARVVSVAGDFDFPNAVQTGYPLQLMVFQGTRFVRYPAAGAPATGDSPLLADGALDEADLPSVLAAGTAAPAGVRIITFTAQEARLALPSTFVPGAATAVVFTILADGSVLSNPLAFVLP